MHSRIVQSVAILIVLTGVTLSCFHQLVLHPRDVLVGPQRGGLNDLVAYFIPCRNYPRICMHEFGQWPGWNPFSCAGVPYLGNPQSALFYPPNWLCWGWDARDVLSWIMVAHHLFAGVGTYLLCRRYGIGGISSLIGGSSFLAAPYLVAHTGEGHYAQLCAVAWMPWALLAYEELRTGNRGGTAMLSVVLAMSFFAGHVQEVFYLVLILTVFVVVDLVVKWRAGKGIDSRWLALKWLVLGIVVVGLVAVDLVPVFVYSRNMIRAGGLDWREAGAISMGVSNLFQLLNPFALGGPDSYGGPGKFYWETLFSFGMVPLVLGVVGLLGAWRRYPVQRLAWFGLVAIGFAMGSHAPVFQVAYRLIPGLSMFRVPSRVLFFCSLVVAILAAAGADSLLESSRGWSERMRLLWRRVMLAAAMVCLALIALGKFVPWARDLSEPKSRLASPQAGGVSAPAEAPSRPSGHEIVSVALRRTLGSRTPWVWLIGIFALVYIAVRWPRLAVPSMSVMLVLNVTQLSMYANKMLTTKSVEAVNRPESLAYWLRQESGVFRVLCPQELLSDQNAWENRLAKVQGYDPVPLSRHVALFAALTGKPNPMSNLSGSALLDVEKLRTNVLDMMNVRFVILGPDRSDRPDEHGWRPVVREWPELDPKGTATTMYNTLYENSNVLPRAFVIGRTKLLAEGQDPVQALAEIQPKNEVLMTREFLPPGPRASFAPAQIVEFTANRVTVEAELSVPGFLVLSDSWYPGWTAEDNGLAIPVIPANVAFRAVPLSAGKHRVVFSYKPTGFAFGAGVSIATWLAVILSAILPWAALPKNAMLAPT